MNDHSKQPVVRIVKGEIGASVHILHAFLISHAQMSGNFFFFFVVKYLS